MRDLTKWPRLVVVGESITPEQAAEVIFRTTDWSHIHSHDQAWDAVVWSGVGLPYTIVFQDSHARVEFDDTSIEYQQAVRVINTEIEVIHLSYLHNEQIASTWIGGRHGWCQWNGQIITSNYNIGKWPSAEHVLEDWEMIASTFPFLNLRAQLWADEGRTNENDDADILVEYTVKHGTVSVIEDPREPLAIVPPTDHRVFFNNIIKITSGVFEDSLDDANVIVEKYNTLARRLAAQRDNIK